jgi:hypothetical protein
MFSQTWLGDIQEDNIGENKKPFTLVVSEAGLIRGFPHGFDIMGLLGSKGALYWLANLMTQAMKITVFSMKMESEFSNFSAADWNRNFYWFWLYSLHTLLKNYGNKYPTFMQIDAWQNKNLNTVLAS